MVRDLDRRQRSSPERCMRARLAVPAGTPALWPKPHRICELHSRRVRAKSQLTLKPAGFRRLIAIGLPQLT